MYNVLKIVCVFLTFSPIDSLYADFAQVVQKKQFSFPRDHGAHTSYKTEWWYFTGHLKDSKDRTFGFELTFFRVGIPQSRDYKSKWVVSSVYLAHFAVTDDSGNTFYHFEKLGRPNFNLAGSSEELLSVWIDDWSAKMIDSSIHLYAKEDAVSLSLTMTPVKPVVLQGEGGLSIKGPEPGQASYYTSFTKMKGTGVLSISNKTYSIVDISAWMDHEVTSSDIAYGVDGWDWFAIQLDNNIELMIYQLRDAKGNPTIFSSGSIVSPDGAYKKLESSDFTIQPLQTWVSAKTGITYPQKWRIAVPSIGVEIEVSPTVKEQELVTKSSTKNAYWEGRCLVQGTMNKKVISGNAYVELVGYKKK